MKAETAFKKITAAVLILTFSYAQLVWAADVRQMLIDAKNFFAEEEAKGPRGFSPDQFVANELLQQNEIQQQQALQDLQTTNFSLTTANGDVLKYVGDKLSSVVRPDGTQLANIATDLSGNILNADLRLADGSVQVYQNGAVLGYQTPDGNQVLYQDGVIQKVIDKTGKETLYSYVKDALGIITETILDNSTHTTQYDVNGKLKEVTRKSDGQKTHYAGGIIQRIVSAGGTETLFTAQSVNGDTVVTPQGGASDLYIDAQGNKFYFTGAEVSKVVLTDNSELSNITWDSNNKVDSATLTQTDLQRFIYQSKQLMRAYDATGVVTNFTYATTCITAVKGGNIYEYLLDGTPTKFTALDGTITTYLTTGTYKGLKDRETSPLGGVSVYEYQGTGASMTVQKREVVSTAYNVTTFDGQANLAQSTNPVFKTTVQFVNDGSIDQSALITATYSTSKNLKLNLVPGTGSTYTWNNVSASLDLTLNKNTDYKVEIKWESSYIGIYVYNASSIKPTTPTKTIADRAWNPKFKAIATNVAMTFDSTASGYYNRNIDVREKSYAQLPSSPVFKLNFKQIATTYKTINVKAIQATSGSIARTLKFYLSENNNWTFTTQDYNTSTGQTTTTSSQFLNVPLVSGKEYTIELRIENGKADFYLYDKGAARPATPYKSLAAFNVSTRLEADTINAQGSGALLKSLTIPAISTVQATPLTTRLLTVNNLSIVKPPQSMGSNPTDFASITYDALVNLKQVVFKDSSKLIFENGIIKQALDTAGKATNFTFAQSALFNITGSSIVQDSLTSEYSAEGKLKSIKLPDMTVHYRSDGSSVEWIDKTDGTELWDMVFNAQGALTDALIITPDGEERVYVAGKLAALRRPDQSKLFYDPLNSQVLKMITPQDLTYNFTYSAGSIVANLDVLAVPAPDALTPVKMEYDTNFNLKKVIRQNQEVLDYLNTDLTQISTPCEAPKVFNYAKDATGKVLSYTVTQDNVVTTYDANNQQTSSIISPNADNPNTLDVAYQYGKIRQIKKNGVVTFNYSYSFDGTGVEYTEINDLEENTHKKYIGGNLITSLDNINSVLSSYAYTDGKVSQVTVSRFNHNLHTYQYSYGNDNTVVVDEAGVVRTYSANQKMIYLEKNGEKYAYSYDIVTEQIPGPDVETVLPVGLYDTTTRSAKSWDLLQAWSAGTSSGIPVLYSYWGGQYVDYSASLSSAGDLKVEFDATNVGSGGPPPDYPGFQIEMFVDGMSRGVTIIPAYKDQWQAASITLQNLTSGTHSIRLKWLNDAGGVNGTDANFQFRSLKLTQIRPTVQTTIREITTEALVERQLKDGSRAMYSGGKISQLDFADGKSFKNFIYDDDGNISEVRLFQNIQVAVGAKLKFFDGAISEVTLSSGQVLAYSYDRDINDSIVNTWVKKGAAKLKYDAQQQLIGLRIDGVMSPAEIMQGLVNNYTGGNGGILSFDGNFATAQTGAFGGGSGNSFTQLISEHVLPVAGALTGLTYRLDASASSNGSTDNGSSASIYLETKDASTGLWTIVEGTYAAQGHSNGGGGGSTAYASTGASSSVLSINIPNVIAVRAQARASAYSNGGGNYGGQAYVYELQFAIADESSMALHSTTDGQGQITGYTLSGYKGTLGFDASGNTIQANAAYSTIQQELTGVIQNYVTLPYKDADFAVMRAAVSDNQTVVTQEYSADGTLETQTKADGTITLFENNKPLKVMDSKYNILITYSYDANGNPTRVYLKNARDTLPDEVAKARLNIESQRAASLRSLAQQKNLSYQSIQAQFQNARIVADAQLASQQGLYDSISSSDAKGKQAKAAQGDALDTINGNIATLQGQLADLYAQEADAYAALDAQVKQLSDQIEADSQTAFTALVTQEINLKKEILRQEVSPIVYDYYRRILGRDPSSTEYDYWITRMDYNSGATIAESKTTDGVNLSTSLNNYITSLPELIERQTYVNTIKSAITSQVNAYLAMTQAQKEAFVATLGLTAQDVIPLSSGDATKILNWLNSRSLHFGQSAFIALETLLDQKGTAYTRTDLAQKAILIDVLTGVISPLDDGDLVISMFAMNKVAQGYELTLSGANLTWLDLQAVYQTNPAARIIAHINGNHYVVITGITQDSITYIDPGAGPDKNNQVETISKAAFLKGWKGNVTAESSLLNPVVTASAQKPTPTAKLLTKDETQKIRGAFFFFLIPFFISFVASMGGAVASVLAGIGTIMAGVGTLVAGALSTIGGFLATVAQGIGYIGSAIWQGISFAASSLWGAIGNVGSFLSQNVFGSLAKAGFGNTLFQTAVKTGLSIATSKGLESLGVNPTIANLASTFVTGGIAGGFDAGFTAANFIQGGVKTLALQGAQTILQNTVMDTSLLDTLNLVVAPFVDGVISGDISGATVQIFKDLPKYASFYGIQKIAEVAGIDSRIAGVAGLPIATALNQGFKDGNLFGQGMINVLNQTVKGTFAAYSTQLIVDQLPSNLGGSFLSSVLSGAFNKVLNSTSPINIVNAFLDSLRDLGQKIASNENIIKLAQAINTLGLKDGLEKHLQDVFERSTIESIVQSAGSVASLVQSRLASVVNTIFQGRQAKKLDLSTTNSQAAIYYEQNPDGLKILGYEENNGFANLDVSGPNLLSADISRYYDDSTVLERVIENGETTKWQIKDKNTGELYIEVIDATADIIPGPKKIIGTVKNFLLDGVLEIYEGGLIDIRIDLNDTAIQANDVKPISYSAANNIIKQWFLSTPGVSAETGNQIPVYLQNHTLLLQNKFAEAGLSDRAATNISFFKGTKKEDIWQVAKNEFTGALNREMRTQLDNFYASAGVQKGAPIYPMFYSGSVEAGLSAIEMGQDNTPIIFAVGGWNSHDTNINNPSVKMFVNIMGEKDGVAIKTSYSGIETLNVMFIGGSHTDYFDKPEYNEFIANARVKAALGLSELRDYIVNSPNKVRIEGNVVYIDLEK